MSDSASGHRFYTIITGVIREALRYSGCSGVVVVGGGPEGSLLESWLGAARIPVRVPPREVLDPVLNLLEDQRGETDRSSLTENGPDLLRRASELAGQIVSSGQDLLLLGTANKTSLLLDFPGVVPPILPLGDIYASRILEVSGDCTLPDTLRPISSEELSAVDSALQTYFEGGLPMETAFGTLEPDRRRQIREMLGESRKRWHPLPLIPKVGYATLGMDLDL